MPLKLCEQQIQECGRAAAFTVANWGNTEEIALWIARHMGYVIDSHKLTAKEIHDVVSGAYSAYVIAARLKPVIDAKRFLDEVRSVL